jgi:hypothetical protein
MKFFNAAILLTTISAASGFSMETSRRQAIQAAIGGIATAIAPSLVSVLPANAVVDEETPRVITRQGGLLVRFHLFRFALGSLFQMLTLLVVSSWNLLNVGIFSRWSKINPHDGPIWMEQIRGRSWCL